jgi:hypothetical protein
MPWIMISVLATAASLPVSAWAQLLIQAGLEAEVTEFLLGGAASVRCPGAG